MNLDRAHLDHFEQALFVVDIEVLVVLTLVPEFEGMDVLAEPPPWAPLIETLSSVDAGRAAQRLKG
jgi:hypothetical protein